MGANKNGDEPGKRMVYGRDSVLWKSGICAGKDTGVNKIAPQGARVLLMDGMAVESAFALLLTKVTKPPYPTKISYHRHNWRKYRFCAISGTDLRMGGERKWQ